MAVGFGNIRPNKKESVFETVKRISAAVYLGTLKYVSVYENKVGATHAGGSCVPRSIAAWAICYRSYLDGLCPKPFFNVGHLEFQTVPAHKDDGVSPNAYGMDGICFHCWLEFGSQDNPIIFDLCWDELKECPKRIGGKWLRTDIGDYLVADRNTAAERLNICYEPKISAMNYVLSGRSLPTMLDAFAGSLQIEPAIFFEHLRMNPTIIAA